MENIVEKTLLYDFYGELLTERRQEIYESVVFNDMSLSEAAEEFGISRQGISDMIHRCDEALKEYESKLHMVASAERVRKLAAEILNEAENGNDPARVSALAKEIMTETE